MQNNEILPCKRCKNNVVISFTKDGRVFWIDCTFCNDDNDTYASKEIAIKCWNIKNKVENNSQPLPIPNTSKPIWDLVIDDMMARDNVGRQRYGTPLQAHNGRDALQDAYEEALDLAVYLRQVIEERKNV